MHLKSVTGAFVVAIATLVILLAMLSQQAVAAKHSGSSSARDHQIKLFKWHAPLGRSASSGTGRGLMKWMMMQNMFQTPAPQSNIIIIQPSQTSTSPTTSTTTSQRLRSNDDDDDDDDNGDDDRNTNNDDKAVLANGGAMREPNKGSIDGKIAIVDDDANVAADQLEHEPSSSLSASASASAPVNELNQRNGNYKNRAATKGTKRKTAQMTKRRRSQQQPQRRRSQPNRKRNSNNNRNKKKQQQRQRITANDNKIAVTDMNASGSPNSNSNNKNTNRISVPNSGFSAVINAFRQLQQRQQPSQSQPRNGVRRSAPFLGILNS